MLLFYHNRTQGIECAFVRKKAKEYGTCKFAEGAPISGRNICIVEDIAFFALFFVVAKDILSP